jgi:DNA-binding winged helix-turn-helix (wHTH) protein/Tol biopolymer transport system component
MGVPGPVRFVRFGPFQLDLRAGELRRNGIKVRVPDQSIKVLALLVENPGDMVTREELHQRLWPNGTIVEFDRSINAAIKRLRQALEDSAEEPKFIETLPRRGYRFLVSVERAESAEPVGAAEPEHAADGFEGQTISHYRVAKKLGQGGMGVVYRAEDIRLGRSVALKFLSEELSDDPRALERFEREARAASALNHPNICTVHEVGEHDGVPFIVMEYLAGKSLDKLIGPKGLAVKDVLNYAVQISDALATAHAAGIIHRDLKPSNIMVSREGLVKLLDFGLAKVRGAEAASDGTALPTETTPLTGEGTLLGTLQYMAPEQLEGKEADARTDIFALGTVIYEMATGKKAFEGASRASLMAAILEHSPPSLTVPDPTASPVLDRVVKKCLAKDPDARWQSARDLKDELEWIAGGSATSAAVVTRPENLARLAWAVAGVVAVIAIVLAFLHFREKPAEARAARLLVLPPENTSLSGPVAISPDGTRLALIASPAGKESFLWVRRLDSLTAQPLAGTEGADDLFWSPDGQFIAFFAQGKLKKIEAVGGPAQTLCDTGNTYARGTWNRDGVIVFPHNYELDRVPAEGGLPTPLTALNQANQRGAFVWPQWPQFLPDGHRFLYQTFTPTRNDGIYVASLDSKESQRLLDSHWMAAYAPALDGREGYLLFIREGTLMAQRFDANHLQLTGKPVPLVEGVSDLSHNANFSVSRNGTLAYVPQGAVKSQLTWFDRAGKRLGTAGLPVQDIHPTLSPDGRRLAVSRADPQSGSRAEVDVLTVPADIWVLDLVRGGAFRLTFDSWADTPFWSPDGKRIAFTAKRDGSYNLYQKASSGVGNEELLLKSAENIALSDWSLDGRFLLYSSQNQKGVWHQWVLPLDGDRKPFRFLQTEFSEGAARLSPDGQWMAYQSVESGTWEVYVRPFGRASGDGNHAAAGQWPISTGGGTFVRWRGDGKELFYHAPDENKMMAVEVKTGVSKGRPTFEAGIPKPLFNVEAYGLSPFTVTTDGQRFLINTVVGEEKSRNVIVVLNWPALLK